MVEITNGVNSFKVPLGAFRGIFEKQGYYLIAKHNGSTESPQSTSDNGLNEVELDEFDELLEKPLAQWSKQEIKDFAKAKDIDLAGTKNAEEARERIKEKIGL